MFLSSFFWFGICCEFEFAFGCAFGCAFSLLCLFDADSCGILAVKETAGVSRGAEREVVIPDDAEEEPDKEEEEGDGEGEGEGEEDKKRFNEVTFLSLLDARSFASLKMDFKS